VQYCLQCATRREEAQAKSEARPPRHGEPWRVRRGCRPGATQAGGQTRGLPTAPVPRGTRRRLRPAGSGGPVHVHVHVQAARSRSGPAMHIHPPTDRCERDSCCAVTASLAVAGRDAYRRPRTRSRWESMDAAPGKGNIKRRDGCADHSGCPQLRPDTCRRSVGGAVGRQSWISDILFSPTAPRC
jgi:hypothetical protein